MHPLRMMALGLAWLVWTVGCFWAAVQVSDGYEDSIGMLLGVALGGVAFVPAAILFYRWYRAQNPAGNR